MRFFGIGRHKKNRNHSDEDFSGSEYSAAPSPEAVTTSFSSSHSVGVGGDISRCSSVASSKPRPQPLPLPRRNGRGSGDGYCRLPSPDDVGQSSSSFDDLDRVGDGVFLSSPPVSSVYLRQELRKSPENIGTRSSRIACQGHNGIGGSRDNFNVSTPAASAPVSPLESPVSGPPTMVFRQDYNGIGGSRDNFNVSTAAASAPGSPLGSPVRGPLGRVFLQDQNGIGGSRDNFNISIPAASAPCSPLESPVHGRPGMVLRQDHNGIGGSRDNFNVSTPAASAPASPLESALRGPPSRVFRQVTPQENQAWSAPELLVVDEVPGFHRRSHLNHVAYSNECSPLHSPTSRSPQRNHRSAVTSPVHPNWSSGHGNNNHANVHLPTHSPPTRSPCRSPRSGCASPVHPNFSSAHDIINHANVHPLPLPPGATLSSPSSASTKSDSIPMKRQWQKGKLIGRGTFGSVYVATNRETGALCAMKEVDMFPDDPKSAESVKQLQQEIKVLSQLKHPNIVQYYGSEIIDDKFYIYLEYVHPGSINKYIRENCGAITESVVRNFTRHILTGLAYLHSKKTVHRDIKGANLLVDSFGVVKLADFGMAKHLNGQRADLSLKGSPYWMAPELMQAVMQKDKSSDLAFAVDIWSLGCTIIEMLTGKPPWSEYEGAAAMFKVMRDTPPIPGTLSPEGKEFLSLCFRRNPAERPPASMLLERRFVRGSLQADGPLNNEGRLYGPGEQSRHRLDQVPTSPSAQSTKGERNSESKNDQQPHHENMNLAAAFRQSPRSTLDPLSSLSSPNVGCSTQKSSPSASLHRGSNPGAK